MHTCDDCFYAGMIGTKCSPSQIVGDAVMDARSICMREYASAPEVNIYGDPNFTFPYVPSHLHHMAFELVKNSLRAVNDKFDDLDVEPPPIRLVIAEGEEDITIKVRSFAPESTVHNQRGQFGISRSLAFLSSASSVSILLQHIVVAKLCISTALHEDSLTHQHQYLYPVVHNITTLLSGQM